MGQQPSINDKSKTKTYKKRKSILSHRRNTLSYTFAVSNNEQNLNLPNLNSANVDELLKVREIDLELAKNIIRHRKTIGYYHRVEDLVVVPGVGAKKFNLIKNQVCVLNNRCNTYCTSSQSCDSLKSVDSFSKPNKLIDLNNASIFELQLIHGVTQEIAASIVHYRSKKGPFKNISDLRRIKCIDIILLDNICRYLTVQDENDDSKSDINSKSIGQINDISNNFVQTNNGNGLPKNSLINGIVNGLPKNAIFDIFELLSAYSPRPIVNEIFNYSRNNKPAIRIASWNLQELNVQKALNLGVKEVICRTILENGWSILAIQSILDVESLKIICEELNSPKLFRVEDWKKNSRQWKYEMIMLTSEKEKLGFIYDSKGGGELRITSSGNGPSEWNSFSQTMLTNFNVGKTKVQILNLKVTENIFNGESNILSLKTLKDFDTNLIICSDFSVSPSFEDFLHNFEHATPSSMNFSKKTNGVKQITSCFSLSNSLRRNLTGYDGIIRHGLSHLAIPSGWSWGGAVSFYGPIWTEIYIEKD